MFIMPRQISYLFLKIYNNNRAASFHLMQLILFKKIITFELYYLHYNIYFSVGIRKATLSWHYNSKKIEKNYLGSRWSLL